MEKRPILKKERLRKGEEHVRWLFHRHITRVHGNSDSMCLLVLLKLKQAITFILKVKLKKINLMCSKPGEREGKAPQIA